MTFAIVETGGKQYCLAVGQKLKIEKVQPSQEGEIIFDKLLLLSEGDKVQIGQPYLAGRKAAAKILQQGRHQKVIVFKYKSKTRQTKKKGHRQPYTEVQITGIS